MTVTVKNRTSLMVPPNVQRLAGIKRGDRLEFKVFNGVITIVPRLPAAGAAYTPRQRRIVDAQLAEAEKGPFRGPFHTAGAMIADVDGQLKKLAALKKPKLQR
jgi:bifunctional DNA-binding transcriptional regulator/antitoxin component of YhaV-PrlF toxin-antitoxin module